MGTSFEGDVLRDWQIENIHSFQILDLTSMFERVGTYLV